MENSLIILIFIASIIYKLYSNYKEEMEKSKKRNLQNRPLAPIENIPPVEAPPTSRATYTEIPKVTETQSKPDLTSSSSNLNLERQNKVAIKSLSTNKKEIETEIVDFDLRQAVIQSAILERPYK